MEEARRINAPVLGFFLVLLGGWAVSWLTGEWWWMAIALVIAVLVGDVVDAIWSKGDSEKSKPKGKDKKDKDKK